MADNNENEMSDFGNETDGSEYIQPSNQSSSESAENSSADGDYSGIEDIQLNESRKRKVPTYHNLSTSKKRKTSANSSSKNGSGKSTRRPLSYMTTTPLSGSNPNSRNSTPSMASGLEGLLTPPTQSNSMASGSSSDKAFDSSLTALEKNQHEILKLQKEILAIIKNDMQRKGSGTKKKSNLHIPAPIRGAFRDGHRSGKDAGLGWTVYKESTVMKPQSEENKTMTKYIHVFVKGIYPDTADSVTEVATERYFQSIKEKEQRASKGKDIAFNKKMMLYRRRKRKLTNRREAINKKITWTQELKDKLSKALTIDYMSTEYEDESDGESVYVVRHLPWRSEE